MATTPSPQVLPGIDVLLRNRLDLLAGHRFGLVTNQTGRDQQGNATIDLLYSQKAGRLVALFSPEHGIRGEAPAGAAVDASVDAETGLPIHSLYGQTRRPTPEMLRGLDLLIFDIQDIGARVYTYASTLLEVLRAGASHELPVVVLDRPNPLNGVDLDGTVLDPRFASFVGPAPIAMRHGLTMGELGRLFNTELRVGANLTVVPVQGWQRDQWLDQTGLSWVIPSPNIRSLAAASVYPGTVLFEGTSLSEGRGTDRPFEWIGAPWIDGDAWARRLEQLGLPGVQFLPATRTPDAARFAGQHCQGVLVEVTDRTLLRPMAVGVSMLAAAIELFPDRVTFATGTFDGLAGTDGLRRALLAGQSAAAITASWQPHLDRFRANRSSYLLA